MSNDYFTIGSDPFWISANGGKSSKGEETPLEKEFKAFTNKFTNWKKKISKDIPINIAINKDNFIIYLKSKRFSKPKTTNNISVNEILNFYDDLIAVQPHNGDYLLYDRQSGNQIRKEKVKEFLILKGRLKKEDVKTDKERPVKCITKENGDFVYVNMKPEDFNTFKTHNFGNKEGLLALGMVRIASCEESASLFGYRNIKTQMLESKQLFEISTITPDFKCKKDEEIRNIIEVKNNGKAYKFLLSEVELILPDLDKLIKGYVAPKDREIKQGNDAKLINAKRTTIPKGSKVKVLEFKKIGGKEYSTVQFNDKNYIVNKKQLRVI